MQYKEFRNSLIENDNIFTRLILMPNNTWDRRFRVWTWYSHRLAPKWPFPPVERCQRLRLPSQHTIKINQPEFQAIESEFSNYDSIANNVEKRLTSDRNWKVFGWQKRARCERSMLRNVIVTCKPVIDYAVKVILLLAKFWLKISILNREKLNLIRIILLDPSKFDKIYKNWLAE